MSRSAHSVPVPFAVRRAMLSSEQGLFAWLLLVVCAWRKRMRRKARKAFTLKDAFDGEWPYWEAR